MCGGGKPSKKQRRAQEAAQQESLALQREQLELAKQSQQRSAEQYEEQMRITTAPPPPAPAPVADVAASALSQGVGTAADQGVDKDSSLAINPAQARQGYGRRRFRTDMAGGVGGLSIPAA